MFFLTDVCWQEVETVVPSSPKEEPMFFLTDVCWQSNAHGLRVHQDCDIAFGLHCAGTGPSEAIDSTSASIA